MTGWQPDADNEVLRLRASMLRDIRNFFSVRGVMEVETPVLSRAAATDPNTASMSLEVAGESRYLHTSPEFSMKRLLAADSGDLYQIARVFRDEADGCQHQPEFTLLEWYRLGFDDERLMNELEALMLTLARPMGRLDGVARYSYQELFLRYCGLDPLTANVAELNAYARARNLEMIGELDRDGWLDWILSAYIQPCLPQDQLTFVTAYPASQAALAKLRPDNASLAMRFELFWGGLELANGFCELTDAEQLRTRFTHDNQRRAVAGQKTLPMDENLLSALRQGLPACSGVALGLDRLLMRLSNLEHIQQVMSFSWWRA